MLVLVQKIRQKEPNNTFCPYAQNLVGILVWSNLMHPIAAIPKVLSYLGYTEKNSLAKSFVEKLLLLTRNRWPIFHFMLCRTKVTVGQHLPGAGWKKNYFTVQICILSKLQFRSMIRPGKVRTRTSNFFNAVGKYFRAGMSEIRFLRLPKEWSIYENSSPFLNNAW